MHKLRWDHYFHFTASLNASGEFVTHQEKPYFQTLQLLTPLGSADLREIDQDSQQPLAEIPPTNLMSGSGVSLSTMAQYPNYTFQGYSLEG